MLTVGTSKTPTEAVAALNRNLKEAESSGLFGELVIRVQLANGKPVSIRSEAAVTGKPA
jgi:hypothetical protein